jgi:hypothetical protein
MSYGFLAIWTEIQEKDLIDYRHWLTCEHIAQRIFTPGFLAARVHVRPDNECAHFILYATEARDTLQSRSYLEILNNPTPWTKLMMPRLGAFDRGAGAQIAKIGDGTGPWLVVSRIAEGPRDFSAGSVANCLNRALDIEGIVTARLLAVDGTATGIKSIEKDMRSGAATEGGFKALLIIEACTEQAADTAAAEVGSLVTSIVGHPVSHDVSKYAFIYGLHPFEGATGKSETRWKAALDGRI